MAITADAMATQLTDLSCRTTFSIKKITEYMLPNSKESFYLLLDGSVPLLVIRPAYKVFLADLTALSGVHNKKGYCHYSEMTRFPKRIHKSANEIHYGLGFRFDDLAAVELFIQKLISIIRG